MASENVNRRPALQLSMLCQRIALDELGTPILLGTFNQLAGPLPIRINFIVCNQYTNGFGHHRQRTVITGPEDEVIIQSEETEFFLRDMIAGHRVDERFLAEFRNEGRHKVQVLLDETVAIEYYFMVRSRPEQPANQPETPQTNA